MHPRNPFNKQPDHRAVLRKYDNLAKLCPGGVIKFDSQEVIIEYNKTLLNEYFGRDVELPMGHLCPAAASRTDYIMILEDLLSDDGISAEEDIAVLDIGTGASCIYPLIVCSLHPSWKFTATEIDSESIEFANKNVSRNTLENRITLILTVPVDPLIPAVENGRWTFCMCNPPFYASEEEIELRSDVKEEAPSKFKYTGNESVYAGSEVAFIGRIIDDSRKNPNRCLWYTSLVGIKSSLKAIEKLLQGVPRVRTFTSTVGLTTRWIIAWSFQDKPLSLKNMNKVKFTHQLTLRIKSPWTLSEIGAIIGNGAKVAQSQTAENSSILRIYKNSWNRAARRKGSLVTTEETTTFRISIQSDTLQVESDDKLTLVSFVNWLRSKIK